MDGNKETGRIPGPNTASPGPGAPLPEVVEPDGSGEFFASEPGPSLPGIVSSRCRRTGCVTIRRQADGPNPV